MGFLFFKKKVYANVTDILPEGIYKRQGQLAH